MTHQADQLPGGTFPACRSPQDSAVLGGDLLREGPQFGVRKLAGSCDIQHRAFLGCGVAGELSDGGRRQVHDRAQGRGASPPGGGAGASNGTGQREILVLLRPLLTGELFEFGPREIQLMMERTNPFDP
ncbi:hypothetical protein SCYAM73S_05937 [Streptomyces cyaneofuscatus]